MSTACHANAGRKRTDVRSTVRRRHVATVLALAASVGMSDGSTYAVCVACGQRAEANAGQRDPGRLEMGHVIPEAMGGRACPCNYLPQCGACNGALGDVPMLSALTPRYDARASWQGDLLPDPGRHDGTDDMRGPAHWLPPTRD